MSTAFRNFIITFALAAALFAVVGYMAVNGVLDGLFKGGETTSEDTTEYSYENAESYYDGEYSGENEKIPTSEEYGDAYVLFYEDHQDTLIGAKFICVNEKTGKLLYESLPIDGTIVVNGYNRTVKEIYQTNGESYLCGKLQYVLGVTVLGYTVFDTESMKAFFTDTELCKEYELEIVCNLPYEVKYEDPEMLEYNEQNPDDIQYITIAGEAIITPENASCIFEDVPEDSIDSKAASAMFGQIYENFIKIVFAKTELRDASDSKNTLFSCFAKTTMKSENYSVFFGLYDGSYEVSGIPELSASKGKEFNWSTLPAIIEGYLK